MKPQVLFQALPTSLLFALTTRADYYQTWPIGTLQTAPGTFCSLDDGVNMQFNGDGNILIYANADPVTVGLERNAVSNPVGWVQLEIGAQIASAPTPAG